MELTALKVVPPILKTKTKKKNKYIRLKPDHTPLKNL